MSDQCRNIKPLIGAYADGELDKAQVERVKAHLAGCAACRLELERIEELHKLVKTAAHPRLADDYWDWQRTKVWHGIRHDRRELIRPRRQSFLFGRFASVAAGLVIVTVIVVAGWRMLGQGSLVSVSRNLMMEKSAGSQSEAVAVTPETIAGETKAVDRERVADQVAEAAKDEVTVGASGKGMAGASRGGSTGTAGNLSREPIAATLRDKDDGLAAAGFKEKIETGKPVQRQARALEQPAPSVEAGKVASVPVPPVIAKKETSVRFAQAEQVALTPELASAPVLPDVAEKDTGTAVLRLTTDSLGFVKRAVVMRSSGRALNDSVAVLNARASRFKPVLREGRPLGSVFQRQYRFKAAAKKSEQKEDKPRQDQPAPDKPQQDKPQPGKPNRSGE